MLVQVCVVSYNWLFYIWPLYLNFHYFLWCLVRTVKVFVINSVYRAVVMGAVLTLETEISVFW
jgi:hypothetical protein